MTGKAPVTITVTNEAGDRLWIERRESWNTFYYRADPESSEWFPSITRAVNAAGDNLRRVGHEIQGIPIPVARKASDIVFMPYSNTHYPSN